MLIDSPAAPKLDFAPYFTARHDSGTRGLEPLPEALRLRYEVYCVDCGFLNAADYPDGQERDEFDDASHHFYARTLGRDLVGYVRLVPYDPSRRFPWQAHCPQLLPGITLPDTERSAEVSRLMVRRDYRRRKGDLVAGGNTSVAPLQDATLERRSNSPQIMLCLYRQMYQRSLREGIRYWYAAMERPLARVLQAMGFGFQRIGDEVDYFGPVAPYLADLDSLEKTLQARNPGLLAWMQSEIT